MRNLEPLPSAAISQGLAARAWLADQLSARLPAVPGLARSNPATVAVPLRLSPPSRPTEPEAEAVRPWPLRSALRISSRPSCNRVRSTASLGDGPPRLASRLDPAPPAPARSTLALRVLPLWVRITGPERLASR